MNKQGRTYIAAEKTRQKVRRDRATKLDVDSLEKPGIDPRLLADPDGTVFSAVLTEASKSLAITIKAWPLLGSTPPGYFDILEIYHASENGTQTLLSSDEYTGSDVDSFPLTVTITKEHIESWVDGSQNFSYKVLRFNGSPATESETLSLIFDRVPPYGNAVPLAMPALGYDVTDGNSDNVTVTLPEYDTHAAGDKVHVYWLNHVPDDPGSVAPVVTDTVDTLPKPLTVPKAAIEAVGDGGVYVLYVLVDKAGNISRLSMPLPVGVAIGPLPDGLQDPVVPLADDDLIDQEDAWTGVVVQVPSFGNWKPTDWVQVTWGTLALGWREVGNAPKFPLEFTLSGAQLWGQYGAASTGEKVTNVSYALRRGTVPQGTRAIDVNVNLEVVGPVDPGTDPEWPDPVNPRLAKAEVYGESNNKNKLLPADEGKDAVVKVVVDATLKEDDVISFYWEGVHITEADHTVKTLEIGNEIEENIPWAYIEARNNGSIPLHYVVERPNVPNRAKSTPTIIEVKAIVLRPDAPEFLGGNTNAPVGWLTCNALYDDENPSPLDPAIRVLVKDLRRYGLKAGDTVTFHWYAVHGFAGEEKIDDTVFDDPVKLSETDLDELVWRVQPYTEYILPIFNYNATLHEGRGRVTYSFELDSTRITSKQVEQIVSMHDAAGSCPLRP
ncbi:hypothetical protein [Pseudomonas sp. JR33AA]|uniref:hypothetical protein n=1 Tax=Pseudomonas sp. JR33AA TaxID=2899113 RepID=UPI001F2BBB87|nr:hypothetical protein [Pseudomonas sp. JR33AA]MCE5979898.1 hypothetical protein [Pseudomonas sp. JR33AA]